MRKSNYKSGTILKRTVQTDEISDNERIFLHDGYLYPDGYGCLIGYEKGVLVHSTGFGNMCFPGPAIEANDDEISKFMLALMHQDNIHYR